MTIHDMMKAITTMTHQRTLTIVNGFIPFLATHSMNARIKASDIWLYVTRTTFVDSESRHWGQISQVIN